MRKLLLFFPLIFIVLLGAAIHSHVRAQDYLYPGIYAVSNVGLRYSGTWSDSLNTALGFRHSKFTNTQFSGVELSFFGTGGGFVIRGGAGLGEVRFCVNASCGAPVDLTALTTPVILEVTSLTEGFHTMRLMLATEGSTSGIFLDYVEIYGDPFPKFELPDSFVFEATIVPSDVTHRETWQIEGQDVSLDYLITTGDVLTAMLITIIVIFVFIFFIMRMFGWGGNKREL